MVTRRKVIVAAMASPFVAPWAASFPAAPVARTDGAGAARGREQRVTIFVADGHHPEARIAARAAAGFGAQPHIVLDDITAVYESLDLALRQAPFAVAGLTTPNALFVLERLAWERGLRTLFRGEHRLLGPGRVVHDWDGPRGIVARMPSRATVNWAATVGEALATWPAGRMRKPDAVGFGGRPPTADPTVLISWLFVPNRELAGV